MPISESHASHIGRVRVKYVLCGREVDPTDVSRMVGVPADEEHHVGDERRNAGGCVLGLHSEAMWALESSGRVAPDPLAQKDINAHVRALLALLAPHRAALRALADQGEATFDVRWESSYLYAGTGPVLDFDCVEGIASLGASLAFDIVAIDDDGK